MSAPTLAASRGTAVAPLVSVNGSLLDETWVRALEHLRVELGVGTIGRATLRFTDPGYALASSGRALIGAALTVRAKGVADSEATDGVFAGTVTAVGIDLGYDGVPTLTVIAHDRAFELARSTQVRMIADATIGDAIARIASAGGLKSTVTGAPTTVYPFLPQADTDLGLLEELTRRAGLDWVVQQGDTLAVWASWTSRGRTVAAPGAPTVKLTGGADLLEFSVVVTADAPTEIKVSGWDPVTRQPISGSTKPGRSGVPSDLADAVGLGKAKVATVHRAAESPDTTAEATSLAGAQGHAGSVVLRGRGPVQPRLDPGGLVDLADVGPASGTYFVQEVEHVFTSAGFDTRFVAGDRARPTLLGPGRAEPTSLRRSALAVGIVTNVDDKQPLGRVKVKFPGLDASVESAWARVAYPGAGKGGSKGARGALWLPDVDDQVLVGFEDGDTRHPVVLGGLLGTDPGFPADLREGGTVKVRRIASGKGARVDLGDGADADHFILLALDGDQHKLRIGKDRADLVMPNGKPLEIAVGSAKLTFDGNGGVTVKATNITLDATSAVKITGATVAVESKGSAEVKGMTVNVKATAAGTVEASGPLTLKGAMVQVN